MKYKNIFVRYALVAILAICMCLNSCAVALITAVLYEPEPTDSEYYDEPYTSDDSDNIIYIETTNETEASSSDTTDSTESHNTEQTTDADIDNLPIENEKYASTNGYNALESFSNGKAMQLLYKRLQVLADKIHTDSSVNAYSLTDHDGSAIPNIIGSAPYSSSISEDELFMVFNMFRCDNPIYYWIDNQIIYSSQYVYLMTISDYASGAERIRYSEMIDNKIKDYMDTISNEISSYRIALHFHDEIIKNMDYAMDDNGDPSIDLNDHNVLGAFITGSGVCEAYAKAFQLLLNAAKIENCYVIGTSGEEMGTGIGHAWNMVKLDNGKWYYCDLTWDDLGSEEDGVQHNNFCVGAYTNVSWSDDGSKQPSVTFISEHIPNLNSGTGEDFQYALPPVSAVEYFDASKDIVRSKITVEGCTYMISGYNELALISINAIGEITIPAQISHNGIIYDVASVIGSKYLYDSSYHTFEDISLFYNPQITSVYFSENIRFISDLIFETERHPKINIDESNPYIYYDKASGTIKNK